MKWVCVHGFKSFIILGKWVVNSVFGTTSHRVPRFYDGHDVGQKIAKCLFSCGWT